MSKFDFESIVKECKEVATKAYNEEIQKMLKEGYKYKVTDNGDTIDYMYDICGGAYIKFKDCRSGFYRELKKYCLNKDTYEPHGVFREYPHFCRQELRVNSAVANAVNEYLKEKYNTNTYVITYID